MRTYRRHSAERRLDQRSTAIASGSLPGHAAVFVDYLEMPITFGRTISVAGKGRCPTRRNDDRQIAVGEKVNCRNIHADGFLG